VVIFGGGDLRKLLPAPIPVGSRAGMVARQLSDLAPDPLFHATLGVACGMAAGLHQ
jgi:hypothetical protein